MAGVDDFVAVTSGDGDGYGNGYGYGSGYGNGNGDGSGNGYGSGYGYGDGNGNGSGSGYGDGDGSGDGNGYGSGYGYGDGSGSGSGIVSFNGHNVHMIDKTQTIVTSVFGNVAKGYILQSGLTLTPCYIAKQDNLFAHGNTLAEAVQALHEKIFDDMDVDEKIDAFISEFEKGKKYSAKTFYDWHHRLTGSCEAGRKAFAKDRGIDIETATYTVDEFIALTENAYGGEIIRQLRDRWNKDMINKH